MLTGVLVAVECAMNLFEKRKGGLFNEVSRVAQVSRGFIDGQL